MFGLSFTHLVLLAILVLIFIGPEQLPEVARTFARLLNEWKRATSDIQSSLTNTIRDDLNLRKLTEESFEKDAAPKPPAEPTPAPVVRPAEHIQARGPTITAEHIPDTSSGHSVSETGQDDPVLPAGNKPPGDGRS